MVRSHDLKLFDTVILGLVREKGEPSNHEGFLPVPSGSWHPLAFWLDPVAADRQWGPSHGLTRELHLAIGASPPSPGEELLKASDSLLIESGSQ